MATGTIRWALVCLLIMGGGGCSDEVTETTGDGQPLPTDGSSSDINKKNLPPDYKPWPCTEVGKACNAHDPCAIDPVCGPDKKCWPRALQDCSDGLDCTKDICGGMGLCKYEAKSGTCALPVKSGGTDDAGTGATTQIKCFKDGDKKPADPCKLCDPDENGLKWSPASGGSCDDGNSCTKNDYCNAGVCKGTYYGNQCADQFGCTTDLCDGKGGCLGNKLKSDWCLINGVCYKDGGKKPDGSCYECDPSKSQSQWTPITNTCTIAGQCWNKGDKHPLKCAECDPLVSKSSWTVKGDMCLINNVCKKPGDKDAIKCSTCDPKTNKYGWTPIAGLCKIFGKCYNKNDKHPHGCAVCEPAVNATGWTVKGNDCLINNVCYNPGDKDAIKCSTCDPSKSKYDWTPIAGLCKINGSCYAKGAKNKGGCAECDPAISSSSWTVKTNNCLVYNVCKKPGDKDLTGCSSCNPGLNKYGWSPLPGLCKIDGVCYTSGAKHPGGCGSCVPSLNATGWTATSGCVIDLTCYATGAKHPKGCGTCSPTKNAYAWTVDPGNCAIGGQCYSKGAKESGGCGTCDPAKSQTAWTKGSDCPLVHDWSRGFGSTSSDYVYDVAADNNGNVFLTGRFYYSMTAGSTTLSSNGSGDIYVLSLSPSGKVRWGANLGGSSSDYGYSIATDPGGNVYVTGYFYNSMKAGTKTLTSNGSGDIFVASYTNDGKLRWANGYGGTSSDYGWGVAADAAGNAYVTGYFYNSMTVGTTTLTGSSSEMFVLKLDTNGKDLWAKSFGGSSSDLGYDIAVDGSGNSYVTGYLYSTMTVGMTTLSSNGSADVYVISLDSAGKPRWGKNWGSTSSDYGYGIAVDGSSNVYLTGYFYNSINFGGTTLTSNGSGDIYVASLTTSGAHRWSKGGFGGTSSDYGYGIDVDSGGNAYVTGYFYNSGTFGTTTLTSKGSADVYVLGLSPTGAINYVRSAGGTSYEYARGIAVGGGAVYVGAYGYTGADFGGGPISTGGSSYDIYIARYAP